jgi:uncharacterized protein
VKIISVKVKPGARASTLSQASGGEWLAQLRSPPVDGKANAELVELVARQFGCAKSAVSIRSGASSRTKRIALDIPADERTRAARAAPDEKRNKVPQRAPKSG